MDNDYPKLAIPITIGSRVDMKEELATVKFNRDHKRFVEDNDCLSCDFFGCECNHSEVMDECPLDDENSQLYGRNIIENYADLIDVIEAPKLKDWKLAVDSKPTLSKQLYATAKLNVIAELPRTPLLNSFIDEHFEMETGKQRAVCRFTIMQLHKRLRQLMLYKPVEQTDSRTLAKHLIETFVPTDYLHLFTFKEKNK